VNNLEKTNQELSIAKNDLNWNSDSVRFGAGERGKCHGFDHGEIHGTATGNLFFLIHGTGKFSSFIISSSIRSWSLFERGSNRDWVG
jgi:hypothetical protein